MSSESDPQGQESAEIPNEAGTDEVEAHVETMPEAPVWCATNSW
ncbi:hypothetical protein [Amycolatopsis sp.]|nr:hypothetical protein [Amycolatopsis sp.]